MYIMLPRAMYAMHLKKLSRFGISLPMAIAVEASPLNFVPAAWTRLSPSLFWRRRVWK